MRRFGTNAGWGWLLLGLGLLALLGNFDVWPGLSRALWGVLFGLGSALFLGLALRRAGDWWAFIPSGVLCGLMLAEFSNGAEWGGAAFLASLGAGFLLIVTRHPEHWWAVIPGGAVLFLGLAATFLVLAGLPAARSQGGTHRWAWYPAAGLLALAVLSGGWFGGTLGTLWPLALGGVLLLVPRRGRH